MHTTVRVTCHLKHALDCKFKEPNPLQSKNNGDTFLNMTVLKVLLFKLNSL